MKWEPLIDAALPYLGPFAVVLSWLLVVRAIVQMDVGNGYVAGIIFLLGLLLVGLRHILDAGFEEFGPQARGRGADSARGQR
ncbi:hypothetical protein C5C71_06455 [Rathayibacter sp. AY1C1]|uniref:hypothetical protein n=1 Tax=Rathayibacter sp. AY1C1 TaxID=2080534 RepID=UPI000CE860F0|nr:hypothetical protein [Rathayibacter sp. AY1C1]PPH11641.1 hypothetical protein C5C71_06455 [Rathayibacter sp. AY1C1]